MGGSPLLITRQLLPLHLPLHALCTRCGLTEGTQPDLTMHDQTLHVCVRLRTAKNLHGDCGGCAGCRQISTAGEGGGGLPFGTHGLLPLCCSLGCTPNPAHHSPQVVPQADATPSGDVNVHMLGVSPNDQHLGPHGGPAAALAKFQLDHACCRPDVQQG